MNWEDLVEPWWMDRHAQIAASIKGGVRDGFLLATTWEPPRLSRDDHRSLWGNLGIIHSHYHHWPEDWAVACDLADMEAVTEPKWGGLTRWREMERHPPPDDGIPMSPTMIYKSAVLAAHTRGLGDVRSVVHWGGGFGLQSFLLRRWGWEHTEYLIDLPAVAKVQHAWLIHALGRDAVHLATETTVEGKINVVPLSHVELVPQGCDVFLSLHALSESSTAAQDYVVGRQWFGADQLVLEWTEDHPAFHGSPHWASIVDGLQRQRRIPPRHRVRPQTFRSRWGGDTAKLAEVYEADYGAPVLYVNGPSWEPVAPPRTWTHRDLDVVLNVTRPNCPIIVVDVSTDATDRSRFDWIKAHVAGSRYRLEEHQEALVFIDRDRFPEKP